MNSIRYKIDTGFSVRLNFLIEESKIRKNEFAKKIGVNPNCISNWINGSTYPNNILVIKKISEIFNVNPNWLMRGCL